MTRKGVGILAGVCVVLLGTLLVTPALIDWTRFKDDLALRMEGALGRKFSIDGKVSFAFLPTPTFFAERVHLTDAEGARVSIAVPRLEVRPRLMPLLAGRLEIAALVLDAPEIHLAQLIQDGGERADALDGVPAARAEPPAGGEAPSHPKVSPIDSVTIENGVLLYQPAGRQAWRFDRVGASFATQAGGGGRLVGAARFAGLDVTIEAFLASAAPGQAAPLNLTLSTTQGAGVLRFGGQLSGPSGDRRLKGKLSFKAGDLSRLVGALGESAAAFPVPLGNVGLDAAVSASGREIDLNALSITLGGVEGTGNAVLGFDGTPQIDVKLAFSRLDLDSLLAGLRPPMAAVPGGTAPPANSPAAGAPPPAAGSGFALPNDVSATLDLAAEVTVFRGGLLRGAHLNAALVNGEVTVNQASVSLPGNSEANFFGFLAMPEGIPRFEGSFEAASDDLRGLLDWLRIDTASVPADRLHAARLAGTVKIRANEIDLDGTQIRLDGTRIDTAATLRLGERPALGASFAIDSLNVDAYWPRPRDPAAAAEMSTGASPADNSSAASWLAHLDANVKGRIGQLTARGLTGQEVTIDGSWLQGQLALRDLSVGDLAGAQLHIDGSLDGLAEGPVTIHGLHYALRSKQPERLLRQVGLVLPVDAERLGIVALSGTLDGTPDALAFDSRSELAGGIVTLAGKMANPLGAPRFDGQVSITHANPAQLVRLWAPDYRPSGPFGGMAVTSHVSGDPSALQLTDLRIKTGPLTAAGDARLLLVGKPRLDVTLSAGESPLDGVLPSKSERPPPLKDGAVKGKEEPRHGTPAIATDRVSAAPRTAVIAGAIAEHWSRDPHDLAWLNRFDASLKLDAKALSVGGNRLDAVSLGLDLVNGSLGLQHLAAQLYGGKLTGEGHLSADGGLALQLALAHAQVRDALPGTADVEMADGTLDADLALSTSGRSTAEWIGRLAGTGKVAVQNGVVQGFDLKAVDDRLPGLDSPIGLLALLQTGLSGGKTHFSALTATVGIGNGLVASDDILLLADGGGANGTVQINLPAYVMDGRAEFHLANAPNGPPLVMRLSGPLDGPRRFVDINEIQQWLVSRGKIKPKDFLKGLLKDLGR